MEGVVGGIEGRSAGGSGSVVVEPLDAGEAVSFEGTRAGLTSSVASAAVGVALCSLSQVVHLVALALVLVGELSLIHI